MRWIGGVLGGLLALLVSPVSAASAACQFRQVAELPVTLYGARALRPVVGATIDGVGANLIFDTGGAFIGLSQASATRLKLHPTAPPPGFQMRSYGQIVQAQVATAHRLAYGGVVIASPEFLIIDRAPSEDVDGFLGEPAFADVDIEIDLADRVIRLFQPAGCAGENLAYWADPKQVSVVDLEPFPKAVRPLGWVEINGVRLRALFDTGAPDTDLTADAAKRAGVRPGDLGVHEAGTAGGLGPGGLKNWQGHFSKPDHRQGDHPRSRSEFHGQAQRERRSHHRGRLLRDPSRADLQEPGQALFHARRPGRLWGAAQAVRLEIADPADQRAAWRAPFNVTPRSFTSPVARA